MEEIKGIENVKEYGKGCFCRCDKLDKQYPILEPNIDEYVDLVLDSKDMDSHNFDLLKKDIVLNQRKIISQKNVEIKKKDKEIKKKNKQIKNKNKELKKILNSTSWKITKPLRKLKSIFK